MAKRKTQAVSQMALTLAPAVDEAELAESPRAAPAERAETRTAPAARADTAMEETAKASAGSEGRKGRETLYIVAPIQWGEIRTKRGTRRGWRRLPDMACKSPRQAQRAAETMVEGGRATGAVVIRQTADTDLGDYDEPVILGRYGEMPEGFGDGP